MSDLAFPRVPIKYIADVFSGGTPRSNPQNWDGDVPFITPPDLNGLDGAVVENWGRTVTEVGAKSGSTLIQNAVLISCRAPVGHIGTVRGEVSFNQGCKAVVPADDADLSFISECLVADRKALQAASRGTTFTELSTTELYDHPIPWPKKSTRRRIANYLDRETGQIDAMIGKLGELEVELVERKREVAANALLPYGVPGDPTSLDGFEELGYTNIASIGVLVDRRQERNTDQHAQYLSLMKGAGVIRYEDKGDVGNKKPEDLTRTIRVKSGDYLVNSMNFYIGSYGRSSYDGVCSSVYLVFSPNEELVIGDFFKYFFANDELRDRIQDLGHGILEHRRGIVWDRFSAVKVPLPPLEEQRRIADHLDTVTSKIDAMLAKVGQLKELLTERRAALITDVVTGRKEVA